MARCSLASPGIMVQLVGTDVGVMVPLSSPGSPTGLTGLENTVRFDMAGCCWGWLCWHNLYGVRKPSCWLWIAYSVFMCVCVWLWWFIVKHIIVSMFELNAYNLYVCLLNFKYISNLIYKNIICTCGIYM